MAAATAAISSRFASLLATCSALVPVMLETGHEPTIDEPLMDIDAIVAGYGAAWNETDEAKRAALLEQSWADEGTYCDPLSTVEGRAALVAHIGGFQAMMPGHTIDQASAVDTHDGVFRFAWVMRNGDEIALEGIDFGELASDGRIQRIVGFFGPFPPLAP